MTRFRKNHLIVPGVFVVFALLLAVNLATSRQAIAQDPTRSAPVTIVSPFPLPVTGSTTVSGNVAATQSGSWNVGINNTTSAPALVRNVPEPYQAVDKTISGAEQLL